MNKKELIYKINQNDFGPFNHDNKTIKSFLNDVIEFKTNYTFKSYIPMYFHDYYVCNLWKIIQIYNFANRGHINVKLELNRFGCKDLNLNNHSTFSLFINSLKWIHIIIIFLAFFSLIKIWKKINKVYRKYRLKNKFKVKIY